MESSQFASWQRSRYCDTGTCVEAALVGGDVAVRDSKNPHGPVLRFTASEWSAFLAGVRDGDFQFPGTAASERT